MLESLGPTFVKLGQLLSTRADIISPELINELSKLQDSVPPFSGDEAIAIIEKELDKNIADIFMQFDKIPLASASIAQVHKAVLREDMPVGIPVAVKVQRPNIENIILLDIHILKDIAYFAQHNIKMLAQFQPVALVNKFSESLLKELDFQHEMENLQRFHDIYKDTHYLRIPKCYADVSTKRVFSMEFMSGEKISYLWKEEHKDLQFTELFGEPLEDSAAKIYMHNKKMKQEKEKKRFNKVIADRFANIALEQIFNVGYFHGDPHPGNVQVLNDGTICFLDFGVMGTITSQQKEYMTGMIIAISPRNIHRFTRSLLGLMGASDTHHFEELAQECGTLLDTYLDGTLEDIELGKLMQDLVALIVSYNFSVPPNITLMSKSLTAIEGIALNLDPQFNILEKLTPFIKKLTKKRFAPKQLFKRGLSTTIAYSELYENIPEYAQEMYNIIKSGNITVRLELLHLTQTMNIFDTIAYRLVFGLVLAALIISSSIIIYAKTPPLLNNISLIGIAGFIVSALMGFGIIIAILIKTIKRNHN